MPVAASPAPRNSSFCLAELATRDTQRREDACERYRRRTLDIVVEDAHAVAVVMQETKRGVVREILELDDDAREYIGRSLHELVNELVISRRQ